MSESPTPTQINDLRADIGDGDGTTFTDDEIIRVWARVAGATNDVMQHEAAAALLIRQLMGNATKLVNYRAGAISESRGDIIKNLERLLALYNPSLKAALGTGRQFAKMPGRAKPRQDRSEPGDFSDRNWTRRH